MSEVKSLIAEIKSKGLLRAGDKLELLYVVAAQLQDNYAALKAERDALAADNVALKAFINQSCYSYDGDGSDVCDSYVRADESPFFPKTPATEAYLNSVRAEGVDSFGAWLRQSANIFDENGRHEWADKNRVAADKAKEFAAQLRAGEPS